MILTVYLGLKMSLQTMICEVECVCGLRFIQLMLCAFVLCVCVCVCVCQVNLMNPSQTDKRPITADAALMNPVAKILALRSGENLQVNIPLTQSLYLSPSSLSLSVLNCAAARILRSSFLMWYIYAKWREECQACHTTPHTHSYV